MSSEVPPPVPAEGPGTAPEQPPAALPTPAEADTAEAGARPLGEGSPAPADPVATPPAAPAAPPLMPAYRPNYVFLAVVSLVTLALDLGSKWWAKSRLDDLRDFTERSVVVLKDHLAFRFAQNRGGAWGLLQDEPESIRRPFFLGISFLAIAFIVSLYRKLTPQQWALKWGLPLVLGGALGNLVNRIQFNYVVDFIDYRAGWVRAINGLMSQHPTDHWPTFNIADVAIVVGVLLMAVDMFTPRKATVGSATSAKPAIVVPAEPPRDASPASSDAPAPPAPKET